MATFHDLPEGLRNKIWSLSIRDDKPGVQIFGAKEGGSRPMTSLGDRSWDFFEPLWSGYFQNLKNYCSDENVSTYLIDGGLWTACKESRRVMESHFKQSDWPIRKSLIEYEYCSDDDNISHRDLFVLQTSRLNDLLGVGYDKAMGTNLSNCDNLKHVAVEYRAEWVYDGTDGKACKRVVRELTNIAFEAEGSLAKIWLIDHTLKRRKEAPEFKEETDGTYKANVFYACDRKFLGVDCISRRLDLKHWQQVQFAYEKVTLHRNPMNTATSPFLHKHKRPASLNTDNALEVPEIKISKQIGARDLAAHIGVPKLKDYIDQDEHTG
ncbi:hypothetical protein FGRMN_1187 [Fusarium graminum]|nr:hypothetical protein FGRMN_1187 [Fusarium graminum]